MSGSSTRGRVLLVALSCTVLGGCRFFDESLLEGLDGGAGEVDAGAPDAPSDGSPVLDAGPGCDLTRPPPRPDGEDDGEDVGELFFVFHHFTLDQSDDRWRTIGWDLDGICSDPPEPRTECRAPSPRAPVEIDGVGGIDNALGHNLLDMLLGALPEIQETLTGHEWGHGSILIRVRSWNGRDDDPRVDVAFTQTIAGTPPLPDGGPPPVTSEDILNRDFPPRPNWDGNDWFYARNASFFEGDLERPRIRVDTAYVADRVLVIDFPNRIPIVFNDPNGSLVVYMTDGHLAGRIADDVSGFDWANFGGRWPVADLLGTLPMAGFCEGTRDYRALEAITDLAADLRAVPGSGGSDAVCNAISGGLSGQGTRGRFAGLLDAYDAVPDKCAGMMMDGGVPDAGPTDAGAALDAADGA